MIIKVNAPPKILTGWIDIATCGLIAPARERIRQEVEAHFADSVARGLADGLTQSEAEAAALRELGDPTAAAKGLAKRHLTIDDEKWLREIEELRGYAVYAASRFVLIIFCVGSAGWILSWPNSGMKLLTIPLFLFIGTSLYSHLRHRYVLKNSFGKESVWRDLLWTHFVWVSGACASGFLLTVLQKQYSSAPIFVFGFIAQFFGRSLRVWRKLRNNVPGATEAK